MYYIEFRVGQCKKRFTAYLSTASSHNYCSRKQANEFQRLLNIQPESIPSYKVKDATGRIQEIHEKIIVPVIFYFSNAKKANMKLSFHVIPIVQNITLGCDFIFDGPCCSLTSEYLTFNDGRSIKINFQS